MFFEYDSISLNDDELFLFLKEHWKKEKKKNLLMITGLSGSGKTTLTKKIKEKQKESVIQIHMDKFILNGKGDAYIENWYNNVGIEYKNKDWYNKDIYKTEYYFEAFLKFFHHLLKDVKSNTDTLYIIEGIQLFYPSVIDELKVFDSFLFVIIKPNKVSILKNFIERNKAVVENKNIEEILNMIEKNLRWNERNEDNFYELLEMLQKK